jgi:hypothetical protein
VRLGEVVRVVPVVLRSQEEGELSFCLQECAPVRAYDYIATARESHLRARTSSDTESAGTLTFISPVSKTVRNKYLRFEQPRV